MAVQAAIADHETTADSQQIKISQTTENAQMRRWYRQWYTPSNR